MNKLFIIFFVSSAVWGNAVDGIRLPVIGSLFPLRIAILIYGVILWYKTYIAREQLTIIQTSPLKTKKLRNNTAFTFVAMIFFGLLTMYWAYDKMIVVIDLVTWISSFLCIFICFTVLKDEKDVIFASRIFIINFLIIGGIGIYESFTGDYFDLAYEYYTRHKNVFDLYMPASIMFNINNLAVFMALSMPVCFVGTQGLKGKMFWDFMLMAFGELITVLTGCNTALVLFCVIFAMYIYLNRDKKTSWIIVITIVMILIAFSSVVANVFNEILSFSAGNEPRWNIWRNSVGVAWKYKFMGVGPGNSSTVNNLFKVDNVAEAGRSHNYLLTVFEEFGMFGFSIFAFWIIRWYKSFISMFLNNKNDMVKYALLFAALFFPSTFCMSSMIGYFYYWLEIGLFMTLAEVTEGKQYSDEDLKELNDKFIHDKIQRLKTKKV